MSHDAWPHLARSGWVQRRRSTLMPPPVSEILSCSRPVINDGDGSKVRPGLVLADVLRIGR
jgi:aspartate carbamoyltransferase catalytic subunit